MGRLSPYEWFVGIHLAPPARLSGQFSSGQPLGQSIQRYGLKSDVGIHERPGLPGQLVGSG